MFKTNVWAYFVLTFFLLILTGSLLLSLPGMFKGSISYIDALFTSTSAVCVTGLIVTNTSNFTLSGQIVIMCLIQLGGLGIMTLTSSLFLFVRGELDLNQRLMVTKITDVFGMHEAEYILRYIIFFTFITEAIGAFILTAGFMMDGHPLGNSIYYGIFHAVSAFCNAGFSMFDNNIIGMNWLIKVVIMCLIVCGGIGFYVVYDLHMHFKKHTRIKIHSKIVLRTTLFLILFGAFVFSILRPDMPLIDGFFQSISARTAGFNSVDLSPISSISKFTLVILMIIGASPGGTGGGIKTSTFFLAIMSIIKIIKGENRLLVYKREVSSDTILKAFSLIAAYLFVLTTGTVVMLFFYNFDFLDVLFEVASALGTVGLSLGVTFKIKTIGKIILILCMYIGRVGPAALMLSMLGKEKPVLIHYPEEKVILG